MKAQVFVRFLQILIEKYGNLNVEFDVDMIRFVDEKNNYVSTIYYDEKTDTFKVY